VSAVKFSTAFRKACHIAVSDGCEVQAQLETVDAAYRNKWQFFFKHT